MKTISVDSEFCQAHGRCYARFPELFDADDDGRGVVEGDGTLPVTVDGDEVAGVCPEAAIDIA
ncbi:ferredoxin [Rhodococcus sp. NPDC003318]|uniref:ferredoxin n=1 Tax=Rhodococcus sp. NPDC003318 TaxID=3364503 RepID=UPI0036840202